MKLCSSHRRTVSQLECENLKIIGYSNERYIRTLDHLDLGFDVSATISLSP